VDRERWGRERATLQRAGPTASVIGFPGTVLEDGNGVRYVVEATGEMLAMGVLTVTSSAAGQWTLEFP